jgi:hypothetical protein
MKTLIFILLAAQAGQDIGSTLRSRVENPKQDTFLQLKKVQSNPNLFEVQECQNSRKHSCRTIASGLDDASLKELTKDKDNFTEVERFTAKFFQFSEKNPRLLQPILSIEQLKFQIRKKVSELPRHGGNGPRLHHSIPAGGNPAGRP